MATTEAVLSRQSATLPTTHLGKLTHARSAPTSCSSGYSYYTANPALTEASALRLSSPPKLVHKFLTGGKTQGAELRFPYTAF